MWQTRYSSPFQLRFVISERNGEYFRVLFSSKLGLTLVRSLHFFNDEKCFLKAHTKADHSFIKNFPNT